MVEINIARVLDRTNNTHWNDFFRQFFIAFHLFTSAVKIISQTMQSLDGASIRDRIYQLKWLQLANKSHCIV